MSIFVITVYCVTGVLCDEKATACSGSPCYPSVLCTPVEGIFSCGPFPAEFTDFLMCTVLQVCYAMRRPQRVVVHRVIQVCYVLL